MLNGREFVVNVFMFSDICIPIPSRYFTYCNHIICVHIAHFVVWIRCSNRVKNKIFCYCCIYELQAVHVLCCTILVVSLKQSSHFTDRRLWSTRGFTATAACFAIRWLQEVMCTMCPQKNETRVILNILYSCKSLAVKFSVWYPDDLSY